jgi:type VI secretion system protein ImpC
MAEIQVGNRLDSQRRPTGKSPEKKLRVLLVGDFGLEPDASTAVCNRSTFGDLLSELKPRIITGLGDSDGQPIVVSISSMDDFHPDTLSDSCPTFAHLRQLRRQLNMPARAAAAAEEIAAWSADSKADRTSQPSPTSPPADVPTADSISVTGSETGGSLFDNVLSTTAAQETASQGAVSDTGPWSNLIREVIDSSRIDTVTQSVKDSEALLDNALAHLMRRILSAPKFRNIEASWRSLDFLVRRLELGTVEFGIKQLSFESLQDDGNSQLLADSVGIGEAIPGKDPWSIMLPVYPDASSGQCIAAARGFAAVGLGQTTRLMFGLNEDDRDRTQQLTLTDDWTALRTAPGAAGIHFAWPGALLRLPYGDNQGRVESFRFEEQVVHNVSDLLWGSGALLTCLTLLQNHECGESAATGQTIEGLPLHVYSENGSTQVHPTCRIQITQADASELRQAGVSPILGYHEDDKVQIPGIFSIGGEPFREWAV